MGDPGTLDFEGLARELLFRSLDLVSMWLPGGKRQGQEWLVGDLRGTRGESLRVNLNTGKWSDFASGERGMDLISLYAAVHQVDQAAAYKTLNEQYRPAMVPEVRPASPGRSKNPSVAQSPFDHAPKAPPADRPEIGAPPSNATPPDFVHPKHGKAAHVWSYYSAQTELLFFVARYDTPEGKQFCPWSWSLTKGRWVLKGFPEPRPLYNLPDLMARPNAPVLIVEGEKAADAAHAMEGGPYIVVTWPNGSRAHAKTDWSPLFGREKILIWPDADQAGREAAAQIGARLINKVGELKILDVEGEADGWDAADAGFKTFKEFAEFARPRARLVEPPLVPEVAPNQDPARGDNPTVNITVQTAEEFDAKPSHFATWQEIGVPTSKNGAPITSVDCAMRVLEGYKLFKDFVWFDDFHKKYFTEWNTPGIAREWQEIDDLKVTAFIQRELGLHKLSDDTIRKAIQVYAHDRRRNEPKEYLEALVWDQTPRIQDFLIKYMGAPDAWHSRGASSNFWIAMVARILSPGCKVDNMIVLEGTQGRFKSTALSIIGGKWFAEIHESVTSKDFFQAIQGKLLIEIAELDAFSRAEVNTIKKVITCQVDRFRASYGRTTQDYPRTCVFVGSTNEEEYLRDATGGRRFWPIRVGAIDLEAIRRDRDQLWAEAVHEFKAGAKWWDMPELETSAEQEARREKDEWEFIIRDYMIKNLGELKAFSVWDVADKALGIDSAKLDRSAQMRIGKALKALGYHKSKATVSGHRTYLWSKSVQSDLH